MPLLQPSPSELWQAVALQISLADASYATSGRIGATAPRCHAIERINAVAPALAKLSALHSTARRRRNL